MEEALESKTKVSPKLNKVTGGESTQRPEGGGGGKLFGGNRRGLPAGLDVSKVGCLKCTSNEDRARDCKERDLFFCTYCSKKGHIEAICFKRLDDDNKKQNDSGNAQRASSPAGGRPPTPHPPLQLNHIKLYTIQTNRRR